MENYEKLELLDRKNLDIVTEGEDPKEEIKLTDNFLIMLQERSSLKKVTDNFFENFKINDPNKAVKERRLKILSRLRMRLLEIGNLDYLES